MFFGKIMEFIFKRRLGDWNHGVNSINIIFKQVGLFSNELLKWLEKRNGKLINKYNG